MDNAQRFLNAFAMIEKQLKQITGVTRYSRFYQLLNPSAALLHRGARLSAGKIQRRHYVLR